MTNPANYVPWIFGFASQRGTIFEPIVYLSSSFAVQAVGGLTFKGVTAINTFGSTTAATLVVLRDPLFVANSVQVSYSTGFTPLIGDFETPVEATYAYNPAGSPWTFAGGSGIAANGSAFNNPDATQGTQVAFLQNSGAKISRTVVFPTGGYWQINFQLAWRLTQVQPLKFTVDGIQVGRLLSVSADGWTSFNGIPFFVTAGTHTIAFETTAVGDLTTFVDSVVMTAAP